MSFDAAELLAELFKAAPPPASEAPQPEPPAGRPSAEPSPARPANRLPGALPSPPLPEWLLLWRREPETTLPPKPCGWCGCSVFWLSNFGGVEGYKCGRCHPPAYPAFASMWVQVVATEDGPQVVRLGERPSRA